MTGDAKTSTDGHQDLSFWFEQGDSDQELLSRTTQALLRRTLKQLEESRAMQKAVNMDDRSSSRSAKPLR